MSNTTIPIVKNDIAGASDVLLSGSKLNILGCATAFPTVNYLIRPNNFKTRILKSLQEIVGIKQVAYTAAANTTYKFVITQDVDNSGSPKSFVISYTSDATGADATIAAALVAEINAKGVQVTASGAATPITLTANAGYPIFTVTAINASVTITDTQTSYSPSGTAADAITTVIAPDGTAGTRIAGTDTVTVTSAAAHLLRPGDVVEIDTTATFLMTYTDNVPFSATYGKTFTDATGGLFRVASITSATEFTLDGVTGNGATNTGACNINARSVAFLTTLAAQTIATGKTLEIAGVATMTIAPIVDNQVGTAGATGTFRVGVGGTAATRFLIEGVNGSGVNSGTITIKEVAQYSRGLGSVLSTQSIADIVSTNDYSQVEIPYSEANSNVLNTTSFSANSPHLYINEGDADFEAFRGALQDVLEGRVVNTIASPNTSSMSS